MVRVRRPNRLIVVIIQHEVAVALPFEADLVIFQDRASLVRGQLVCCLACSGYFQSAFVQQGVLCYGGMADVQEKTQEQEDADQPVFAGGPPGSELLFHTFGLHSMCMPEKGVHLFLQRCRV